MSKCRPAVGITCVPNGEQFYQECLDWHLTLKMSPQEVHDLGLKEVARIKTLMNEVSSLVIIIVVIITCFSKLAFVWRLEHDVTSIHT